MPKLDQAESFERNPIPPGEYTMTLKEIKAHEGPNMFEPPVKNEETGEMEPVIRREFIWRFVADTIDPKLNKPYEYAIFTSRYYNPTSEKNKMTLLVRLLAPDATDEERKNMIEMDHFIGKKWKVRMGVGKSKTGKEFPIHLYFIPLDGSADPAPVGIDFTKLGDKPVDPATRGLIETELRNIPESKKDEARAAIALALGRLRYESWGVFLKFGDKDADEMLKLIVSFGEISDSEIPF